MNSQLTKFQRLMVINAYPVKMAFNVIGGVLSCYFLWLHELVYAIAAGSVLIFGGTILSARNRTRSDEIARTLLGKIFLRFSAGWGLLCYLASHILIPASFWLHNLYLAAAGIGILLLGLLSPARSDV